MKTLPSNRISYKDCDEDIKAIARNLVQGFGDDKAILEGAIASALNIERYTDRRVGVDPLSQPPKP
jgi:hypothetical protein